MVRATEQPGPRGFDGGKRVTGVKRLAVVDTLGLVWGLSVTPAGVADCKGARAAVKQARAASGAG
jgi:putative transposase